MPTSLTPFPFNMDSLTNITPLTFRDASTFLEELAQIGAWLKNIHTGEMDTILESIVSEAQAGIANAESTILATQNGWQALFTQFMADVETNIGEINNAVIDGRITTAITGKLDATEAAETYLTQTAASETYTTVAESLEQQADIDRKADDIGIIHNLKQTHMKRTRAACARAAAGTGFAKFAFEGDSTVDGAYGGDRGKWSWPAQFLAFLVKSGYPSAGTGLVSAFSNFIDAEPRITYYAGVVSVSPYSNMVANSTTTNGVNFSTLATGETGTIIDVYYDDMSAPFEINVDGGPKIPVTPTNTQTIKIHSVTGLANTTHEANAFRISGTMNILGFELRKSAYGIRGYNAALSGSKAESLASPSYQHVMRTAVASTGWSADCVFIMCETNDSGTGTPVATYKANLQTAINVAKTQGADIVLVTGFPNNGVNHQPYTDALYQLANENDIPLIDVHKHWGTWAESSAQGLFHDNAHPNAAGYADAGRAIYKALNL